ncbi:MAG: hypothetical protein WCP20_22305 [Desulfuromonadales bacterium]
MRLLNLSNEKKRDASVGFESRKAKASIEMVLPDGTPKQSARALKATLDTSLETLLAKHASPAALAQAMIDGDPEADVEQFGMLLSKTRKVYLSPGNKVAYCVKVEEVVHTPDGAVKEIRPCQDADANISGNDPLRWTGKLMPKAKAARMFIFTHTYQVQHVNGLTFDFLYDMAKQLHESKSLMLLGAGPKGSGPVVMSHGGTPYRAFLEGRVEGEKYCLALHLSNLEMKPPATTGGAA